MTEFDMQRVDRLSVASLGTGRVRHSQAKQAKIWDGIEDPSMLKGRG